MKNHILNYLITPIILIVVIVVISFSPTFFPKNTISNVKKSIKSDFFKDKKNENILLFFGYVGCVDICTPRLKEISDVYEEIKDDIDVKFYFINLTDSISNEIADLFVKNFNKDFTGIQLQKKDLVTLKNDFDVFSVKSLVSDYDLDHTSFLFLVKRENDEYKIRKIFTASKFEKEILVKSILGK